VPAELHGAPLLFAPTQDSIGISVALAAGDPSKLSARVRATGTTDFSEPLQPEVRAADLAEWRVTD
jgi:hypothetical protein